MTILGSLLPGVRELRSPLTAGLLWLASFAIFAVSHHSAVFPDSTAIRSLRHLLLVHFPFLTGAIVIGFAYLIGIVAMGTLSPLIRAIGRLLRVLVLRQARESDGWTRKQGRIAKLFRFLDEKSAPVSTSARGLIIDAITATLAKASVPGSAAMIFPVDYAISGINFGAAQLSQTAPSQYQEYDRARSEAEFRLAVVPPLIALSIVAPIPWHIWLIVGTIAGCTVLLAQAVRQVQLSNDILANAAFLDYITIPTARAVIDYIPSLVKNRPSTDGAWAGAIIAGLRQRAYFEETDAAIHELVFWADRDNAREFFHRQGLEDLALQLDRLIKENSPPDEEFTSEEPEPSPQGV